MDRQVRKNWSLSSIEGQWALDIHSTGQVTYAR